MPKKKRVIRKEIIWSGVIAVIMVSSIFGVIFSSFASNQQKIRYNDTVFERQGDYWVAKIGKQKIRFTYFPAEVDNIVFERVARDRIMNTKMVYLTSDLNDSLKKEIAVVQYSLQQTLLNNFGIYSVIAQETNSSYNLPVIRCVNATQFVPVLEFKYSNSTEIKLKGNCIKITADSTTEMLKMHDRIVYGLFGIIK